MTSVSLSADGRCGLSGSHDRTVRLWDVERRSCLRTLAGHEHWVTSVSLSADGRLALSGGHDRTVRLWDARGGSCLRTLEGHDDCVTSVCLSADGRLALSGSRDPPCACGISRPGRACARSRGTQTRSRR